MNIQNRTKYRKILKLFDEVENLEVLEENTNMEKLKHTPTGWYFYTGCGLVSFHRNRIAKMSTESIDGCISMYLWNTITLKERRILKKFLKYHKDKAVNVYE